MSLVPDDTPEPVWPALQGWREALRRFNDAEGFVPQAFAQRRTRLLNLLSRLTLLGSLPFAAFFLIAGHWAAALVPLFAALTGWLSIVLLQWQLPRPAALLYCLGGTAVVMALGLLIDLPTEGLPRSSQLYLLPLFVCSFFLLQYRQRWLRNSVSALILGAFVLLQTFELRFVEGPAIPLAARHAAIFLVALLSALLLYLCVLAMLRDAHQASELELDFARGIAAGEIEPFFQPQCGADGVLLGAEVLMRWRHPTRGLVPPAEFVGMAEATGLIKPAAQRLLELVCQRMLDWQQGQALAGIPISINVSSVQLQSAAATQKLIQTVPASLREAGLVKFELTESAYAQDFEDLLGKMQHMREQGIRLALDDFGTGFSSLSLLKRLPLDQLKVDQSFVHDLPDDADACRIASTIVQLGHDLGLDVVAEGVENARQLDCLRSMGCRAFQGHWFARPVDAGRFERLAESWRQTLSTEASPPQTAEPLPDDSSVGAGWRR